MTTDRDPKELLLLAAVIEAGNFSAAARALGSTRQSVQRRIARLEDSLGLRLIERSTRQARPTAMGELLYAQALVIRESMRHVSELVARSGPDVTGRLRLSTSPLLARFLLPSILERYARERPNVELEVLAEARSVDHIHESVDLAIRVGSPEDSSLRTVRLGQTTPWLVARADRFTAPIDLDALHTLPIVRYGPPTEAPLLLNLADGRIAELRQRPRLTSNSLDVVLHAVLQGTGAAMLPDFAVAEHVSSSRLDLLLPPNTLTARPIHAVFVSPSAERPALAHLLELMRLHFDTHASLSSKQTTK